jgi:hypothetical protein
MYKPKKKIRLTTTLVLLRKNGACESGYKKLRKHLGLKWPDDKPINLLVILKNNGVQDMLWCLRATVEPYADYWKFLCNMYADFAESVLPIYQKFAPDDDRVKNTILYARTGKGAAGAADAAWAADAADAADAAGAAGAAWAADAARAAWDAGAAGAAGAADAASAASAARAAGAAWAARAARAAWDAGAARAASAASAIGAAELKKQAVIIRRYLK